MTAQIGEILILDGKELTMATEPLEVYLNKMEERPEFFAYMSALWRGYVGTWEIDNNKLFLLDIDGFVYPGNKRGMDYLFPGQSRVFANWFNGVIRVPQGKLLHYIHQGYGSIHENDILMFFEKGVLKKREIRTNSVNPNDIQDLR
jgi:hypothetical protein